MKIPCLPPSSLPTPPTSLQHTTLPCHISLLLCLPATPHHPASAPCHTVPHSAFFVCHPAFCCTLGSSYAAHCYPAHGYTTRTKHLRFYRRHHPSAVPPRRAAAGSSLPPPTCLRLRLTLLPATSSTSACLAHRRTARTAPAPLRTGCLAACLRCTRTCVAQCTQHSDVLCEGRV